MRPQVRLADAGPGPAPAFVAPSSVPRLVSAGLETALKNFDDPDLLAAGRINLISVEAVQKRFGARWALRQDQVYDFAEKVLERGLGAHGAYLRVSETDFLIAHPELGRLAAQADCLRRLKEILNHFLGESHEAGEGVLQVTKLGRGSIEAIGVDLAAVQRMEETGHEPPDAERRARRRSAARLRPEADEAEDRSIVDRWSPFVASDGRELRVSAVLEPVYELRGFTRIGFRMVRQVLVSRTNEELSRAAVANLSAADLLRVDLATLARGVHRLQAESEGAQQLSLIVPLSYASLASQRGRAELARPIREASSRLRCGVICEVTDVEGVPAGALLSAVSLIRPLVLLVAGRLNTPSRAAVDRLAGGGLQAVTIECPTGLSDPEFSAWSSEVVAAGRRLVKSIIVFGVASTGRTAELAYRGATHASLTRGWQGSDPD